MSEKLLILKDSIDHIIKSETFVNYSRQKDLIENDSQYQMYKYILNNKDKFSTFVINRAKLKYVYKQAVLTEDRKQLDQAFNSILELYNKY